MQRKTFLSTWDHLSAKMYCALILQGDSFINLFYSSSSVIKKKYLQPFLYSLLKKSKIHSMSMHSALSHSIWGLFSFLFLQQVPNFLIIHDWKLLGSCMKSLFFFLFNFYQIRRNKEIFNIYLVSRTEVKNLNRKIDTIQSNIYRYYLCPIIVVTFTR